VVISTLAAGLAGGPVVTEMEALLREAQQRHPNDYWINFYLGYYLQDDHPREAVGCFRAALAIRPRSDQG
jgi:hypothetical protein